MSFSNPSAAYQPGILDTKGAEGGNTIGSNYITGSNRGSGETITNLNKLTASGPQVSGLKQNFIELIKETEQTKSFTGLSEKAKNGHQDLVVVAKRLCIPSRKR